METADSKNAKQGVAGLYLVKDHSSDGRSSQSPIDIVAIHGINGHCVKSWEDAKTGTYWLRDLLPGKLPHARIMTFQYDSKVWLNTSAYGVHEIADQLLSCLTRNRDQDDQKDRPIVFLAHSLGGIITKSMLTKVREDSQLGTAGILNSTKGIIFFGTPHRGSKSTNWAAVVSKIASTTLLGQDSQLLKLLELHSPDLLKISQDFRGLASEYAITSFYEQNAHRMARTLIVDKMSAIVGLVHEDVLMLGGDHSSMCKFAKGDPRFDTVWCTRQFSLSQMADSSEPNAMIQDQWYANKSTWPV
ncbi:Alpha/Beta hydrolase protein [Lasiosphaeria ovina]|uniref:Alpha/Beta hydrolase protein n=1 Tax=Lasiosphaeria ovina TaxID=92902 RepID=A0AAE0NKL9_9PEZI|nr:Alpha/Beta hydrolase protein [Lasiosphaeria ovina]